MFRYAVVLLVLVALPLRANLGESVEQCVKRYGKPTGYSEPSPKQPFGTLVFVAGDYTLVIFLLNNAEVGARVSKSDKSVFSDAELKTVMEADAPAPWETTKSSDPACLTWARADKATALYDKDRHLLIFTSPTMADAVRRQEANPPAPAGPAPVSTPSPAPAPVYSSGRVFAPASNSTSAFPPPTPTPSPAPAPADGK